MNGGGTSRRFTLILVLLGFTCDRGISAQPQHFDAASVKPNTTGAASRLSSYRGRRFIARYVTLQSLIATAYGAEERELTSAQIAGGPRWLETERFDVEATAPDVPDSPRGTFPAAVLAMLRALLENRFQLRTHVEARELPFYALVLARRDGALGSGLKRRATPCIARSALAPSTPRLFAPAIVDRSACAGRVGPGLLTGNGLTMDNLATGLALLVPGVDRPVIDRTGIPGTFDVDLTWNFEGTAEHLGVPLPAPDRSQPNLFTALQEQLGLKLEAMKGPINVVVIDHVEPLREN